MEADDVHLSINREHVNVDIDIRGRQHRMPCGGGALVLNSPSRKDDAEGFNTPNSLLFSHSRRISALKR